MGVPGSVNNLLGAGGAPQYLVERSLRLNSADSAYLSRTPASAGNRKTWTWAGWVKLDKTNTTNRYFFTAGTGTSDTDWLGARFGGGGNNDGLIIGGYNTNWRISTSVFRDPSAWYHVVIAFDSTQATTANQIKAWVNNVEVTWSTSSALTQNTDYGVNQAAVHYIGYSHHGGYFSGYLADIHFIDGQALTPSSFTEVSATTGQLIPKAYTGSFGTNGFWLKFSDNSAATATTLGKDYSGNSNNWSPTNLSVTAGAGNDSLVDTPSSAGTDTGAGGEVRGNYCTWNPLAAYVGTLANGNLDWSHTTDACVSATLGITSGKWYWECVWTTNSGHVGLVKAGYNASRTVGEQLTSGIDWAYAPTGLKWTNNTSSSYGASFTVGDVIGVAFDADNGTLTFYKNNASQGTAFTGLTSGPYFPSVGSGSASTKLASINFGSRSFAYTAPSGFKALCDTNMTAGTITTSGSFTGNANADGPFIWLNGVPTAMTINSNAVTFGTHADKLSNGFKVRSSSSSYNTAGSNTYSITTTGDKFKYARAQSNP